MSSLLLLILILTIWHSILFYGKNLGLSVILFIIPLLLFLYNTLKSKIKNKKGLLLIIPIVLLSLTYLLFDNAFFKVINIPIIAMLFILLYIFTIKPTFNLSNLIESIVALLFEPFNCISNIYHLVIENIKQKIKMSNQTKKIIKSILIILPIILLILVLLSSADQIFNSIFEKLFTSLEELSIPYLLKELLMRLIPIIILFFYLGATINFILYNYSKTKYEEKKSKRKVDSFTIKLLLTTLNIIYIIFDIIQIRSLLLHHVSMDISYAEYARQGFFQLMFVSLINIIVILISKKSENQKDKKTTTYIKIMNILMIVLTFVIIISAFIRMYMYECEFGYTLLRLLVYITLATEVILLIPTIIYITNSKFNIVKSYMIILISVYTIINFINVDYIIAYKNINRYHNKKELDIVYLENNSADNIPLLIDLYNKTTDQSLKEELKDYLTSISLKSNSFQEYNISRVRATNLIKNMDDFNK